MQHEWLCRTRSAEGGKRAVVEGVWGELFLDSAFRKPRGVCRIRRGLTGGWLVNWLMDERASVFAGDATLYSEVGVVKQRN